MLYTIKTFREIRRQTELQSEAYLVVASEISSNTKGKLMVSAEITRLYGKWHEILKKNIPAALQADRYLVLTLQNRGRSDVVAWEIRFQARATPGNYLSRSSNIGGEGCTWSVAYQDHRDMIAPGDRIEITVAKTGVFPEIDFQWTVTYRDMRDVESSRSGGDRSLKDKNVLADPAAKGKLT